MTRVGFATSPDHPRLIDDDQLAVTALRSRDIDVEPLVWGAPAVSDAVVVRSCWDYHREPARFARWIEATATSTRLINPAAVLLRNLHKRYLVELSATGVVVPPTLLVRRGGARSLDDIAEELGTHALVIKPAISLSAFGTWRSDALDDTVRARFAEQLTGADLLVQRYVPEIVDGELSLVYFAGRYSHAVKKRPAPGDFRVQRNLGGTCEPADPGDEVRACATRIIEQHAAGTTYARVDGVVTARGFELMELELIDPVLFLGYAAHAADQFAHAILEAVRCDARAPSPVTASAGPTSK